MKTGRKVLLAVDGVVNLVVGLALLLSPAGLLELLGLPRTGAYFYASILGAVIFGIGLALLLDLRGAGRGVRGLGIGGAIMINFCGGGALVAWLLLGNLNLPVRGHVTLWAVAVFVLGIGCVEVLSGEWKHENR